MVLAYYGGYGIRGGYYYYGFDWTYLLLVIGLVLSLVVSGRMKATASKYSWIQSRCGLTGAQAAQRILAAAGVQGVTIGHISGNLTDHYNPANKQLNLSDTVYNSTSLTAIGVAAHECGHAIQHAYGYSPLSIRSTIVPIANIGSSLSWPIFFMGLIFGSSSLTAVGIILFSAVVVFQLVTLPVEFNASSRALTMLENTGIMYREEIKDTKKVLRAAAMTYVAALAQSALQLIRLLILAGGRRRDD